MFLNAEINHLYGDQGSKEMNNNCVFEKNRSLEAWIFKIITVQKMIKDYIVQRHLTYISSTLVNLFKY